MISVYLLLDCEQTCLQKKTPYSHVDYISFHVGLSLRLL